MVNKIFETSAVEDFADMGSAENKFAFLCSRPAIDLMTIWCCCAGDMCSECAAVEDDAFSLYAKIPS
jgi:hypothetical protein